jgi:GDP-L-fucose synthase
MKPEIVIDAAAKVGGISANNSFPVEFLSTNLQIQTNLFDASHAAGVNRLVFLGSACIYPGNFLRPIREVDLMSGPLEVTNEAYAVAKIAGIEAVKAYRKEYSRKWISIMPTNLYGPNDNFDLESSHVLPAMIRKFHEAKVKKSSTVELWGSGKPRREFLHVDDLASAILHLLENYDEIEHINVGTGEDLEIRELASLIASVVGFKGEITWDISKPDGTFRKVLDISKLNKTGWKPEYSLLSGIQSTYDWYSRQF